MLPFSSLSPSALITLLAVLACLIVPCCLLLFCRTGIFQFCHLLGLQPRLVDSMGGRNSIPAFQLEEKGVVAAQLYKLCAKHGCKLPIKTCRAFVENIWNICPWVQHSGIQPRKWKVVGQQMASYDDTCPGKLTPEDFTVYKIVDAALHPQKVTLARPISTQVGSSLAGSDSESSEEEGRPPPPLYPWEELRRNNGGTRGPQGEENAACPSLPRQKGKGEGDECGALRDSGPEVSEHGKGGVQTVLRGGRKRSVSRWDREAADEEGGVRADWTAAAPQTWRPSQETEAKNPPCSLSALQRSPQGLRPSGLLATSASIAIEKGEEVDWDDWGLYPVFTDPLTGARDYRPVPFKMLKELKEAVTKYGPSSPYASIVTAKEIEAWAARIPRGKQKGDDKESVSIDAF
ncbi:uncharacterized protein LOC141505596 [Macrotis lagotis]|uniref:uncharacterized protein LOC141505596 n=1 Tax=Macrotis lagotis TaxID=92651 RepID=UPI003D69D6EC